MASKSRFVTDLLLTSFWGLSTFFMEFANLFPPQTKHRQKEENTDNRHNQSANSTRSQREPESLLIRPHHKWNETQNGGNHCKKNRQYLCIPRLCIGTKHGKPGEATTNAIILIQNIDAGIYRNTTKQHKRSKTTLIKIQAEPLECKEHSDIRYRNNKDNSQRLFQRIE